MTSVDSSPEFEPLPPDASLELRVHDKLGVRHYATRQAGTFVDARGNPILGGNFLDAYNNPDNRENTADSMEGFLDIDPIKEPAAYAEAAAHMLSRIEPMFRDASV